MEKQESSYSVKIRKFTDLKYKIVDNLLFFVLIFIIISFLLSFFIPKQLPNILYIKDASAATTALSMIATALASILGIIIAILLVSFELLHRTYAHYAFEEVFRARELKLLFTFYLATISISVLSATIIENPPSIRNLNLLYLSMFLFFICVAILYPCSKRILTSTKSRERIITLIEGINFESIKELENHSQSALSYINTIEKNPIYILSEIAVRSIKDDDCLTAQLILIESREKLLKLLKQPENSQNRRVIIRHFLIIISNTTHQAIKNQQIITLNAALNMIEAIHSFCAKNKFPWDEVVELNQTLKEMLEQMMEVGLESMVRQGMWTIEKIFKEHLMHNVPPESEIRSLHMGKDTGEDIPRDINIELQWETTSKDYVHMIYQIIEKAIELRKGYSIRSGLSSLTRIVDGVVRLDLGNLQKGAIVWKCYDYAQELILRCADAKLYERIPFLSPFDHVEIYHFLERNIEFSRIPLRYFGETLVQLTEKGIVDTYDFWRFSYIGDLAIDKIDDSELHAEALIYICKVFNRIRSIIEGRIVEKGIMNVIEREKYLNAYADIFDYLNEIDGSIERENKRNDQVKLEIFSLLKEFKNKEDFKKSTTF